MLKSRLLGAVGIVAVVGGVLVAQTPASPAFDVASIKPNKSGDTRSPLSFAAGGRFTATNVSLRELIRVAFGGTTPLYEFQIVGGPDWVAADRFDIEARAESGPTDPNRQLRLRTLLEDRFKLKVRHDTRDLPVYALTLVRTDRRPGEQLRISNVDCTQPGNFAPIPPARQGSACGLSVKDGSLSGRGVELARVAQTLESLASVGSPVLDRTELSGRFDIDLQWSPLRQLQGASVLAPGAPDPSADSGVTIFTALREQLGLKLDSTKGPVDVLVIDGAERPTAD